MEKKFITNKVYLLLLLCCAVVGLHAQEKPSDSINIRKDYRLPDPKTYESYYDVSTGMYYLYPKVGNVVVGAPVVMTPAE